MEVVIVIQYYRADIICTHIHTRTHIILGWACDKAEVTKAASVFLSFLLPLPLPLYISISGMNGITSTRWRIKSYCGTTFDWESSRLKDSRIIKVFDSKRGCLCCALTVTLRTLRCLPCLCQMPRREAWPGHVGAS